MAIHVASVHILLCILTISDKVNEFLILILNLNEFVIAQFLKSGDKFYSSKYVYDTLCAIIFSDILCISYENPFQTHR